MEKLWAYLTIKQLIEQAETEDVTPFENGTSEDESPPQRALDLALRVRLTETVPILQQITNTLK